MQTTLQCAVSERAAVPASRVTMARTRLEPATRRFIDRLTGAPPLHGLDPAMARAFLRDIQSRPVALRPADIEDTTWPVGPDGATRVRIYRPQGATGVLPILLYCHGGGWVLGDRFTHERLMRELAEGTRAAVIFVDCVNAPEARYPAQNEQAYACMLYAVENARRLRLEPSRLAIAGDGTGGNMAAVVALLAKERQGPDIALQVLLHPLVDYMSERSSYRDHAGGPWLDAKTMQWMFGLAGLDGSEDRHAYPLRATGEQLRGLPDALVISTDGILRDEGEEYALRLGEGGARVTCIRYNHTIPDFAVLNPLADTPAARGAIQQAIGALKGALRS